MAGGTSLVQPGSSSTTSAACSINSGEGATFARILERAGVKLIMAASREHHAVGLRSAAAGGAAGTKIVRRGRQDLLASPGGALIVSSRFRGWRRASGLVHQQNAFGFVRGDQVLGQILRRGLHAGIRG